MITDNHKYETINIDGRKIFLYQRDKYWRIGTRFEDFVKTDNTELALDFFKNYVGLLSHTELKMGWKSYNKAISQLSETTIIAFFNYMEGKKIVRLGKSCFKWV